MGAAAATLDPPTLDRDSAPSPENEAAAGLDLVSLCILAVNRLAPATLRSAAFGKAFTVVVPDPQVGAVFRAALERMGMTRSTDRLIEIVVAGNARRS
jgi:hypothetical protein